MAHLENAGYRLLSFKYVPNSVKLKTDEERLKGRTGGGDGEGTIQSSAAGELPSLSSLMNSIQEIEATVNPESKVLPPARVPEPADQDTLGNTPTPAAPTPLTEFHLLGDLPTELRLKIWNLTFLPQVVELRPTRTNYSPSHDDTRQAQWQSGCSNPAALSVSVEARSFALEHFRVAFPLAAVDTSHEIAPPWLLHAAAGRPVAGGNPSSSSSSSATSGELKGRSLRRMLYVSPEHDTVCLLDPRSDFMTRIRDALQSFRDADPLGRGIGRLAMSVRGWNFGGSAEMLRDSGRTIFKDLEQLVLFMYTERWPPEDWREKGAVSSEGEMLERFRKEGNRLELVPCEGGSAWSSYRIWSGGKGRQFRDEDGNMMRIGRNQIKVMDLEFKDGW